MPRVLLRLAAGLLLTLVLASDAHAQAFSDGFTFTIPQDDTTAAPFLPAFLARPITDADAITSQGDAFVRGDVGTGEPIRFWGGNLVADAAFPRDDAAAAALAGRLRNLGFNLVRFHHIDNPWRPRNIFAPGGTRALDAEMLGRMERLIAHLKAEGVYVNMNLNVSRPFSEVDGVAGADSLVEFAKGVTLFDPQLIALQKEYARQLLTHVNPHTGRTLAEDPVLAMVEIANENSLYALWRNGALRPFGEGGSLMLRHAKMLDDRWHDFLRGRYGTTDALRAAWNADATSTYPNLVVGGDFEADLAGGWINEQHNDGAGTFGRDAANPYEGTASARVTVTTAGSESWHVQPKFAGFSLVKDSAYTVSFAVRADAPRSLGVNAMKDTSPWSTWHWQAYEADTEWRRVAFSFIAPQTIDGQNRLAFPVGDQVGSVWIDDVSIRRASKTGLDADEALGANTVRRIEASAALAVTDARLRDQTAFYIALQDDYYAEMAAYLRDDLGVTAPLSSTNWNFGLTDLAVQSKLDYLDNHAYWDHPHFPGEPWSPTDWQINNEAMVRSPQSSTIARLMSGTQHAGKPYTISEYNHAFPNRFQSEAPLFLAAYAAFQGVDGLMFYDYDDEDYGAAERQNGYFGLKRNPVMMALMPSVARAYRSGLVAPAQTTLALDYSRADVERWPAAHTGWDGGALFDRSLALRHRVVSGTFDATEPFDEAALPSAPAGPYVSDTGEIVWDADGLLRVATPHFVGATGFFDEHGGADLGPAHVVEGDDFGTLTWIALDDQPLTSSRRSLLTFVTAAQNRLMRWDGTRTVGDAWGRGPMQVRPGRVTLRLDLAADSLHLIPLGPDGTADRSLARTRRPDASGRFSITLDHATTPSLWFGVEAFGSGTGVATESADAVAFAVGPVYPNPARTKATVQVDATGGAATLTVFDVLGRSILTESRAPGATEAFSLDVSGWPPGVYVLRVQSGPHRVTRSLVVR